MVLGGGFWLMSNTARETDKPGELIRKMDGNNYVLAFAVIFMVSAGFVILNRMMDAEKKRLEEPTKPNEKQRAGSKAKK
jgi:hypothetical protein